MNIPNSLRVLFSRSDQGRGVDRIRRAGLTGVTRMASQGITIAAGFISLPLTIGYLGKDRYGIWITINSLLQWVYISNIGLSGNALINKLSEANGKDNKKLGQEVVATAFWTLAGLSFILLLLFAASFTFVNWAFVFNIGEGVSVYEIQLAVIFAFVSFVVMFPTSMVDAVYQGYQEGFVGDLWNIAGSIASLIALIVVIQYEGGLPLLVVALFGVRILFSVMNAFYLFIFRHRWLSPAPRMVTRESFNSLVKLGWKYLAAQLSGIGMFQSQLIILTQILGPGSAAVFGVAQRVMTAPFLVINMFASPFMSAYGEAKARNDWAWIEKNLRRTVILALLGSVAMIIPLAYFAKPIIYYLSKGQLFPSENLIWVLVIYTIATCIVTPMSVMIYGLERVGAQAIISALNGIFNVALGIILTRSYGIVGMAIAMSVAFIMINPFGVILVISSILKSRE